MKWYYILLVLFVIPIASAQSTWDLNLTFVDEDNNSTINPTVTIDGNAQSVSNGVMEFTVVNESSVELIASLTTYGTRTWTFGLEKDTANWTRQMPLLKTVDGTSIQFRLRNPDGNVLITDGNVTILHQDENGLAGRFAIGADSLFTAFLSPFDENYLFVVEPITHSDFNYVRNIVTIQIPKDEDDLTEITPFDVKMRGIGIKNVLNTSLEQNFRVFPYSVPYYIADLNASTYFGRKYYFRLTQGNFDENVVFTDDFTGSDADPPDASKWLVFEAGADTSADIEDNDLNLFSPGSGRLAGVFSDVNVFFNIGDSFIFEWTSVNRPTGGVGSEQFEAGFIPDTNQNAFASQSKFSISRLLEGTLQLRHLGSADSTHNDGGSGSIKLTIKLERTGSQTYKVSYFINDNNKIGEFTDTSINDTWKTVMYVRAGSGGTEFVAGKMDDAKLSTEDAFEIQPYLSKIVDSRQVEIQVARAINLESKQANIRILSESFIENAGLQQVETVVTDDQGIATMSFISGNEYKLTLFDSSDNILLEYTFVPTPTQSTLFIYLEEEDFVPSPREFFVTTFFNPAGGTIDVNRDNGTVNITIEYGSDVTVTDVNIIVVNDDLNRTDSRPTITASPMNVSIDLNGVPLNLDEPITIKVNVIADGNSIWFQTQFNQGFGYGGIDYIDGVWRSRFKTDFGCVGGPDGANSFCLVTFLLALIISAILTASAAATTRILNLDMAGIVFMGIMAFFAYMYWVPLWLYGVMALMTLIMIISKGRN